MKTFDNPKDCLDYLNLKAKVGETVKLDEKSTVTNPRRVRYFTKGIRYFTKSHEDPKKEDENKDVECELRDWKKGEFEEWKEKKLKERDEKVVEITESCKVYRGTFIMKKELIRKLEEAFPEK